MICIPVFSKYRSVAGSLTTKPSKNAQVMRKGLERNGGEEANESFERLTKCWCYSGGERDCRLSVDKEFGLPGGKGRGRGSEARCIEVSPEK